MMLEILVLAWDRHKHVYIKSICHMTIHDQVLTNVDIGGMYVNHWLGFLFRIHYQ
jgi:hypothetical protein